MELPSDHTCAAGILISHTYQQGITFSDEAVYLSLQRVAVSRVVTIKLCPCITIEINNTMTLGIGIETCIAAIAEAAGADLPETRGVCDETIPGISEWSYLHTDVSLYGIITIQSCTAVDHYHILSSELPAASYFFPIHQHLIVAGTLTAADPITIGIIDRKLETTIRWHTYSVAFGTMHGVI
jgi:hypothetical protein